MAKTQYQLGEEGKKILTRLKHCKLDNVKVKVVGTWIWVSGDTKQYAEKLKNVGLRFATKKKVWYFTNDNYVRRGKTFDTLEEVEMRHETFNVIGE